MSALPVETLTEDDVVILLAPVVLEALMRTVTHLPPAHPSSCTPGPPTTRWSWRRRRC
jgi:hypothetical protein